MNNKIVLALAMSVSVFLYSCTKNERLIQETTVRAVMENDNTRTSVTDEGCFSWTSDDKIWLHTTSGSVVGTLSSGAGTSDANFSYEAFVGELTGKALYPYNVRHAISGDEISVVMPGSYDLGSNLTNTNAVMYGVNVGGTLKFSHLAGVMRFKFKNVPPGTDKFQITLDKKINGIFTVDFTEDYPVLVSDESSVDAEKTITLNFNALTSTSDISLYVPLPLGTYTTLKLDLWAGDRSIWAYSNTVTNKIDRKTLMLMPVVSIDGSVDGEIEGGDSDFIDLSADGTANSYIVPEAGSYKFTPTKGNSSEPVGTIASAEALWETFGTGVSPNVGDLVKNVKYKNGSIIFETSSTYNEGNAVIAAKDADGTILWSWHIWLTDQPEGQEYYNDAGIMMDRNLGATSATPGDVEALGLLYQWGRKDPFLNSSTISSGTQANSTITWPSYATSHSGSGNIEYTIAHPTTFIRGRGENRDWYYTGTIVVDNTRWTTMSKSKSIYDPCPAGWRVPDGNKKGVWSKALALGSYSSCSVSYDRSKMGVNFSGKYGASDTIWYPATGYLEGYDGVFYGTSPYAYGRYWSASPSSYQYAHNMFFGYDGVVYPYNGQAAGRASALSVRCVQE